MTKPELRAKYKALRESISKETIETLSLDIANNVLSLPIWHHDYFNIFLPIVAHHEVDTGFILHILAGKDKNIVISKSDFNTREMAHFLLTDNTKLQNNEYGIPEPIDAIPIPVEKIQVVFVPLLAFDVLGNRVGYGKGFYDKFLAKCSRETIKIGLSFFGADVNCSDIFESDVRLDYCVTPEMVYRF